MRQAVRNAVLACARVVEEAAATSTERDNVAACVTTPSAVRPPNVLRRCPPRGPNRSFGRRRHLLPTHGARRQCRRCDASPQGRHRSDPPRPRSRRLEHPELNPHRR